LQEYQKHFKNISAQEDGTGNTIGREMD